MNWDQIQGNWMELQGRARQQWGDLTDDDLSQARGDRERLEGVLQQRYGKSKEEARAEVDQWAAGL